jgi:hypothetical protein
VKLNRNTYTNNKNNTEIMSVELSHKPQMTKSNDKSNKK